MSPLSQRSALQRWEAYPFAGFFVLSLFAFFTPGPDLPQGPDVSDKLAHASIFVALALTGRFAGYAAAPLGVGLVGYAAVSEVLQATLPISRTGDWHDVLADGVGVLVGLLVGVLVVQLLKVAARTGTRRDRPPG